MKILSRVTSILLLGSVLVGCATFHRSNGVVESGIAGGQLNNGDPASSAAGAVGGTVMGGAFGTTYDYNAAYYNNFYPNY